MRDGYKILIWGGGSKTRIVVRMLEELYGESASIVGIFDPYIAALPFPSAIPHYTAPEDLVGLLAQSSHFIVCIGGEHGFARVAISSELIARGLLPIPVVSRYAILDEPESIADGMQAMPGAIVHKFSTIGRFCILNTNASVDHECHLGDGVHIMGSAAVAGRVSIGDYSAIGTNATVLPDVKIGRNVLVGAGAVVTGDVDDGLVVAGVPARILRTFEPTVDLGIFSAIKAI